VLWDMVRQAVPRDLEARDKAKSLAATDTIARGNYEGAAAAEEGTPRPPARATPAPETRIAPAVKRPAAAPAVGEERLTLDRSLQLAALSRRNGQPEEARRILDRAIQEVGPAAELTLALADLEVEPLRQALAQAEERLRARPDDAGLLKARDEL